MDNQVITKTVDYDPSKHYKIKKSATVGTKDGKVALLVQSQPKDIMFDLEEMQKLDKQLRRDTVVQSVGRAIAPTK